MAYVATKFGIAFVLFITIIGMGFMFMVETGNQYEVSLESKYSSSLSTLSDSDYEVASQLTNQVKGTQQTGYDNQASDAAATADTVSQQKESQLTIFNLASSVFNSLNNIIPIPWQIMAAVGAILAIIALATITYVALGRTM